MYGEFEPPFRNEQVAAPLKRARPAVVLPPVSAIPQRTSCGPIEASRTNVARTANTTTFRNEQVAAPLKRKLPQRHVRPVPAFRNEQVAAPLKRDICC